MDNSNPFHLISSEKKYENPWISVREDRVIRPGGKEGIFGVVSTKDGTLIAPIDHQGNIYLNYEFGYAINRFQYKLFGGGLEKDEDPLVAAKRELSEESGIDARDWIPLGYVNPYTMVVVGRDYIYLARDLVFLDAHPEEGEMTKIHKVPFSEALDMVYDGEITHAASVIGILRAKDILGF